MRISLAWSNLTHQKKRSAVAVAGIAFATVLVFMQLGFLRTVQATATVIHEHLDFDLMLVSSEYVTIYRPHNFPRERLYQVESCPGVARVVPLYVGFGLWRNAAPQQHTSLLPWSGPAPPEDRRGIMLLACRPTDPVFRLPEVQAQQRQLEEADTLMIDRRSRPEFGPQMGPNGRPLRTELGLQQVKVIGQFTLGRSFGADGTLITSDETFARVLGGSLAQVCVGLVQCDGTVPPEQVAARLNRELPADVQVRTRRQAGAIERTYWVENTATGIIFRFGVVIAFVVGAVFTYQVISSDIVNRLGEYATLKAMGYGPHYLSGVVLQQSLLLAVFGYLPGLLIALGLYEVTYDFAGIPIRMTVTRTVGVLVLTMLMCALSGLVALRKVKAADPADLF